MPQRKGSADQQHRKVLYEIDRLNEQNIKSWKKSWDKRHKYEYELYQCVHYQQQGSLDEIKKSLLKSARQGLTQNGWHRLVKAKYLHSPLSTKGSLTSIGQRFNIGQIQKLSFPPFGALYLASNRATANAEVFETGAKEGDLTPNEYALTNAGSISYFCANFHVEAYIDLTRKNDLHAFIDVIKKFEIMDYVDKLADKAGTSKARIVRKHGELKCTSQELC